MSVAWLDRLDSFTLLAALSAFYLGSFVFSCTLYAARARFPGAGLWLGGQALLAIGMAGTAFQAGGLPYALLALSNVSLLASVLLLGHALWRFSLGRGFPSFLYLTLPLAAAAWFVLGAAAVGARIVIFSFALGALALFDAAVALRGLRGSYRGAARVSAVYFVTVAAASFGRVIAVAAGSPPPTLYQEGRFGAFSYLMAVLVAFFNLFGYFMLSAVRRESELAVAGEELRAKGERLTRLVAMKDALIGVLGHDLRAPLGSAARYTRSQLLEYEGDLNQKRESVATLCEGLERAAKLLDNLVAWARSESGKMALLFEPLDLGLVLAEAAADIAAQAEAKGVRVELSPGGGLLAGADQRAAATVFRNVLSNAVKYSKAGGAIKAELSSLPDGGVLVAVEDEGVGFRSVQLERLFQPGRTVLTLGTNGEQGTGMGLALCKAFMEGMGGTIKALASPAGGARIELRFPPPPAQAADDEGSQGADKPAHEPFE